MPDYGKIMTADQAVSHIKDGDRIMIGGFGICGSPVALVDALTRSGQKELTVISNGLNTPGEGLGKLYDSRQVKALIGNYYSWNRDVVRAYNRGELDITLWPQGTLAEAIRAGGCGIPAFYVEATAGTMLGEGKETREFDGKTYVLERAIRANVALIKAHKADPLGNLIYSKTARNYNPMMATAADYTIVQVDEIVELGELSPDEIVTPHVYVDAIVEVPR